MTAATDRWVENRAPTGWHKVDVRELWAYRELVAHGRHPEGLLRSELLRAQDGRWLVHTLWRDHDALLAARAAGVPPAALLMAERLRAEHSHDLLTVVETL